MGLFNKKSGRVPAEASDVQLETRRPPLSLWADGLGKLATRVLQILMLLAIIVLAVWGLRYVSIVWIPVTIALFLASAFAPPMNWMRRHGVPAALATTVILFAAATVLGLIGWLIVSAVRNQWDDLYTQAQEGLNEVLAWVQALPFAPTPQQVNDFWAGVVDFVTSAEFGSGALAGVGAVTDFLAGTLLMVVVLFFFLKDGPGLWEFLLRPFEDENYARARRVGDTTVATLGAYVRGTAVIALIDAVGIGIGLVILQVPLAVPLTVLVFLLAFIPIVGATLAGVLAALVALVSNGLVNALLVVGVVVLVQQLEGNLLQPVVMGRSIRLHPLVVLIALTVGTLVGGVLGAVLAVPLTAVVWGITQVWDGPDSPVRWARRKRPESEETVRERSGNAP